MSARLGFKMKADKASLTGCNLLRIAGSVKSNVMYISATVSGMVWRVAKYGDDRV